MGDTLAPNVGSCSKIFNHHTRRKNEDANLIVSFRVVELNMQADLTRLPTQLRSIQVLELRVKSQERSKRPLNLLVMESRKVYSEKSYD